MAHEKGFNYTDAIRRVAVDMAIRLGEFAPIRMDAVGVSLRRTKTDERFGVWASLMPLRFEGGVSEIERGGARWGVPEFRRRDKTLLYILTIYAPRFIDLSLTEKINTLLHELYHISPRFNGDIRRFEGRCYAHGASRGEYDQQIRRLTKRWLKRDPPPDLWDFLRYDTAALNAKYGKIIGSRLAIPKLRRLE